MDRDMDADAVVREQARDERAACLQVHRQQLRRRRAARVHLVAKGAERCKGRPGAPQPQPDEVLHVVELRGGGGGGVHDARERQLRLWAPGRGRAV
eukprot:1544181-Prymnesium_polylepis.1